MKRQRAANFTHNVHCRYAQCVLVLLSSALCFNVPASCAKPAPHTNKTEDNTFTPATTSGESALQSTHLSTQKPPLPPKEKPLVKKTYSPGDLSTIYHLIVEAQRLHHLKQEPRARENLQKAISFDPSPYSAYAHHTLGVMLDNSGDLANAVKQYEIASSYAPKSSHLALLLGMRYKNLRQIAKAIKWFETYLALCPDAPDARELRTWISTTKERGLDCSTAEVNSPDYFRKTPQRPPRVWPPGRFPLKLFIQSGQYVPGYRSQYRKLLIDSFQDWCKATSNRISWRLTSDRTEADIICSWVSAQNQFAGGDQGSAAGLTRYWQWGDDEAVVDKAEIQIWTMCPGDTEIKHTCLHEVGHALGLEHSPNPSDAMYYLVSKNPPAVLSERDKSTIRRLYAEHRAFKTSHTGSQSSMLSHPAGN